MTTPDARPRTAARAVWLDGSFPGLKARMVVPRRDRPTAPIPADRAGLHDVRAAVAALRDLRKEIAARQGDESKLTDAHVKSLIEAGRR